MPAYNFKAQFVPAVEAGKKVCTIRAKAAKIGTTAYLFTGMRTKACKRLGQGTITNCVPVRIGRDVKGQPFAALMNTPLTAKQLVDFVLADGFSNPEEFVDFFEATYKSPRLLPGGHIEFFSGYLVTWRLDK